jgi:multidrug efflux pump subunit AcrB
MIMKIVRFFLEGPFAVMFIVAALLLGGMALVSTPREEDPQIIVPMADVEVAFPGHSPSETEELVTRPLERIFWQLEGVEHVYSASARDGARVTVRFHVGEDRDRAMVRLRDKMDENLNRVPDGVTGWRVIPVSINDVPIVILTLTSPKYDGAQLRRIAEELGARLESIADISRTEVVGGYPRTIRIEPILENLAARQLGLSDIQQAVRRHNSSALVGKQLQAGQELLVMTETGLTSAEEVARLVLKAEGDRLVRLSDVARVIDAPRAPEAYVRYNGQEAVTVAFSKKAGVNAVTFSEKIIAEAKAAKGKIIPADVQVKVTRNQGASADERVNGLVVGMFFAIVTVILLIALTMGWRESLVVGFSVPVSFALALFTNYAFGFTLNRVTLFALILSLGLVVDDPITNVDNIQRHIRMGKKKPFEATLDAVKEVLPPVILSTIAIIVSFAPMFFITGMMGPYMGPMAINVPLTVSFSTVCALTFVPFMAYKLLGKQASQQGNIAQDVTPTWVKRLYAGMITPFFIRWRAILLLVTVGVLVVLSILLMLFKVPLKMLPYDNRDELQLVVRMLPGTSLEKTTRIVGELENYLRRQREVVEIISYVGVASPIDFNGLVRHYGMRNQSNHADLRLNLLPKAQREMGSHEIALRLRDGVESIASSYGAMVNIVEVPPGPPVLATITAEVYGAPDLPYEKLLEGAHTLGQRLSATDVKHVKEIDLLQEPSAERWVFRVDAEKAMAHGIALQEITGCLGMALGGASLGNLALPDERQPLSLHLQLSYGDRHDVGQLKQLTLRGRSGSVELAELGSFERAPSETPIMHKNLKRVVFVTAEPVGRAPGELILGTLFTTLKRQPLPQGITVDWAGEGEWEITLRVFRDLGIAFGVALLGILLLLIVQTRSFSLSLVMMCAIPLTIIGIAPGFYLLNGLSATTVGGYLSPVFFTATGMIGMIALGGIVIRNSIVLLEFITEARAGGMGLHEAVTQSGAVRFRPIMLTALTTLMGAWPIALDPIFSGLAWALIFGLIASTIFTMVVIPVIYMLMQKKETT